ncbi:MAG: fibronectin type III domain-containing protein, partial [Porphyromonadaceae bacterium]|nr:fibronectin type III domain-containing protein [Porphyromonadaceae bacterium]
MIQIRFRYATLALALLLGSVSLWGQVNRNRPTTRPETVGTSILPNGGLEDPA